MRRLMLLFIATAFLIQTGCGGGGGAGAGGSQGSTVSGTASKGLIKNGTVKIYALNADGTRGSLLAATMTDSNGRYSQSLSSYAGPILAVAYGTYTDEATGAGVTLDESNGLRAALPYATGTVTLPITALTDLAVRKAGPSLTATNITNANTLVSTLFNVDITGSNPVDATASAMSAPGVTSAQRNHTLALAAFSQMASTSSGSTPAQKLENTLITVSQGMTSTSISEETATAFTNAVTMYLDSHSSINAVVTNSGGSALVTVGSHPAVITLALSGAGSNLYGGSFTLTLPAGVTLKAESDGTASNCVIGLTDTTSGAVVVGKYTPASGSAPATLKAVVASSRPIANGSFLIVNAKLDKGVNPSVTSFTVSGAAFVDPDGSGITGSAVTVSDLTVD